MSEIKLNNLHKSLGAVQVLRDINLTIEDEEFCVLFGPSGCGKSILLRTIAGLEDIGAGTIELGGEVVNDLLPRDRNVAMVFQSYALHPQRTVRRKHSSSWKMYRHRKPEKSACQVPLQPAPTEPQEARLSPQPDGTPLFDEAIGVRMR